MLKGTSRAIAAGVLGLVVFGTGGCIVVSENSPSAHNPTVGRELCDLKSAHDKGALNEQEYNDARQKVLARLDKPART